MFTKFTAFGSSLRLLKVGERGVISRVKGTNPAVADQLRRSGISPGTSITLEQRFPRFVVRTHQGTLSLTQAMIQSIYIRIQAS